MDSFLFDIKNETFKEILISYGMVCNCADDDHELLGETLRFLERLVETIPDLKERFAKHLSDDLDERSKY